MKSIISRSGRRVLVLACMLDLVALTICAPIVSPSDAKSDARSYAQAAVDDSNNRFLGALKSPVTVLASNCLSGLSLTASTPTFVRARSQTTGTGIASPCGPIVSGAAVHYATFQFNLTGCNAFPSQVTISTCPGSVGGTGACSNAAGTTDTVMYIYRAGGSLTAGTGTKAPFNPNDICTNLVAANDDLTGAAVAAGGSSCDGPTCHPACALSANNPGMFRSLGPGYFNVVIAGSAAASIGNYNLFVNAPAAGCVLSNDPTAADSFVSGQILDDLGTRVEGAVVSLDGSQTRKTITDAVGQYHFDRVETNGFYLVTPTRANYIFNPSLRMFSQLGETTSAGFTATFTDRGQNPLDTPEYFVRQHYLDFLGREPDEAGFNFWSNQMLECGADGHCLERRRINVSAAYFLSIEFNQTGGFVDGLYRVSYGRPPRYGEFQPDRAAVGRTVIVGRGDWQQQLETNKSSFVESFVGRASFRAAYDALSDDAYLDTLIRNAGVSYSQSERDALLEKLSSGELTRARVLRQIADDPRFLSLIRNERFVLIEYFGYLRRDPDEAGYQFWLKKLNQFNGNFEQAQMVEAFTDSIEYRARFPR